MINRKNLRKLARYLLKVKPEAFNMSLFVSASAYVEIEYLRTGHLPCGTAACAAGYGPAAGIKWDQPNHYGWLSYIDNNFFSVHRRYEWRNTPEYLWCFYDDWASVDNTPRAAAARILYMLKHGVPPCFTEPTPYHQQLANRMLAT